MCLFLFFKRKTAYEMRISDWSSDVCSSDLAQLGQVSVQAELDEQLQLTTGNPTQLQQVVSNLIANAIDAMSSVTDRPRVLRVKSERKIGRASCRESVCQYV